MKKLLITGAHSYVGDSVAETLRDTWEVDTLDMHGKSWKQADFSAHFRLFLSFPQLQLFFTTKGF